MDGSNKQEIVHCTMCKCAHFADQFEVDRLGRRRKTCRGCKERRMGYKMFVDGIEKMGMTIDDLDDYIYVGGNGDNTTGLMHHRNYFALKCPGIDHPEPEEHCVCGHAIRENCYIRKMETGDMIHMGICCVKRFMPESGRTCGDCAKSHRNRKVDRCNDCRKVKCDRCGGRKEGKKTLCTQCYGTRPGAKVCGDCGGIHRNRKVDRCNGCRSGKCDECGQAKRGSRKVCNPCYYKPQGRKVCKDCDNPLERADESERCRVCADWAKDKPQGAPDVIKNAEFEDIMKSYGIEL